jgi:hypothetical protein
MNTTTQMHWHVDKGDDNFDRRITSRTYNYNTWATFAFGIDSQDLTVFLHSPTQVREVASRLTSISHELFMIANEMDIVAQAKAQSQMVG